MTVRLAKTARVPGYQASPRPAHKVEVAGRAGDQGSQLRTFYRNSTLDKEPQTLGTGKV